MSGRSNDHSEQHNASDALARLVVAACEQETITGRAFSVEDYAALPPFNWDVRAHEECAALHLIDQAVNILHVVSTLENGTLV